MQSIIGLISITLGGILKCQDQLFSSSTLYILFLAIKGYITIKKNFSGKVWKLSQAWLDIRCILGFQGQPCHCTSDIVNQSAKTWFERRTHFIFSCGHIFNSLLYIYIYFNKSVNIFRTFFIDDQTWDGRKLAR